MGLDEQQLLTIEVALDHVAIAKISELWFADVAKSFNELVTTRVEHTTRRWIRR